MGTSNKYTTSGNNNGGMTQFNPSSPYYKTCCCHVRKFTVTAAIIEIFIICFMLVAVIPDLSSKICETEKSVSRLTTTLSTSSKENQTNISNATESTTTEGYMDIIQNINNEILLNSSKTSNELSDNSSWYNHTGTYNQPFLILRTISCNFNILWLILALIKIIAANFMFYGIKSQKWFLFIPHIFCRCFCILIVIILCMLLIIGAIKGPISSSMASTAWITTIFGFIFCIFYTYILICQIKCCQFVKKSEETGISYSSTRPVAPPTMSGSETRPPPNQHQTTNIPMATFSNQRPMSGNRGSGGANAAPTVTRGGRGSNTFDILPPLRHSYRS